ncbi:MAG: hypothetical protein R3356_03370, partial [Eudoraea sp.]|nr:hypothetical protein [Eudoraea sp.]
DDIHDSFEYILDSEMLTENCRGILTDLRGCTLNFEMKNFKGLLEYIKSRPLLANLKIAVIVDSSSSIVFPMMASNEKGMVVQPFSTMEAATKWVLG